MERKVTNFKKFRENFSKSFFDFFITLTKNKNPLETISGFAILFVATYFLVWGVLTAKTNNISGYNIFTNFSSIGGLTRGSDVSVNGVNPNHLADFRGHCTPRRLRVIGGRWQRRLVENRCRWGLLPHGKGEEQLGASLHSLVKEAENHLRIRAFIKMYANPFGAAHTKRGRQIGREQFGCKSLLAALEVAQLNLHSDVRVPLAHQQSNPFACNWLTQHGKTRKISPFELFPDMVFFLGVCGEFREFHRFPLEEYKHESQKHRQESCIESGKQKQVLFEASWIEALVVAVGDEGGKGGDEGARTANVHADKQVTVIVRELGKKNGGGHVADNLAGEHAEDQRAFR